MLSSRFSVAVIGAGPAGLTVARYLAQAGVQVTLVEQAAVTGGWLKDLSTLFGRSEDAVALRQRLLSGVDAAGVTLLTNAQVQRVDPMAEGYRLTINGQPLSCHALVVATGWDTQLRLEEHGLTAGPQVRSLSDLARLLQSPTSKLASQWRGKRVGFILDVSNPYSKVSTATAYQLSLALTQKLAAVCYVLCRDARVAGYGLEGLYGRVRRAGVLVLKYEGSRPELLSTPQGFVIRMEQPSLGLTAPVELAVDQLVVDEAIASPSGFAALSAQLDIRLAQRGRAKGLFFGDDTLSLEDTGTERAGIFLAGGARAEMDLEETMLSAGAAAARVLNYLQIAPQALARVEESRCARCLTCVRLCPYHAITIDVYGSAEKAAARINERGCRGCGSCVAACPARAIELLEMSDEVLVASLGGVSR